MPERLIHSGLFSLASKLMETVLALTIAVLLARLIGPQGYGVYSFALAAVSLASIPTRLGLPQLVVRETARGQATSRWESVRGLWQWSIRACLVASGIVVCIVLSLLWLGPDWSSQLRSTMLLGLLLLPILSLTSLSSAMLRGLQHIMPANVVNFVFQPALLVTLILISELFLEPAWSASKAMGLTVISGLGALVLGSAAVARKMPRAGMQAQPRFDSRAWLAATWPMAMTQGAHQLNRYIDVLLLGILATMVDSGIYRIAAQGATLVSLGMTAVTLVAAPRLSRLHAQGKRSEMQQLVRQSAQAGFIFAALAAVGFAFAGQPIMVSLFGDQFRDAWLPLLILSASHVLSAAIGPSGMLLNMTGHERAVTRAVGVAAAANIILNILLIPIFGSIGAASATAFSLIFWKVWLWFTARERLDIRCSIL